HQMASNPLPPEPRRPGSVGRGTGVQVATMDDAGNLLPAGAQGEVVIKGPNVTRGYHNNPQANTAAFTHGWFPTRDPSNLHHRGLHPRVAPNGRPRPPRRRRVSHPGGPHEGIDYPRR